MVPVHMGKKKRPRSSSVHNGLDIVCIETSCAAETCFKQDRLFCSQKICRGPCKPGNMESFRYLPSLIENQNNLLNMPVTS